MTPDDRLRLVEALASVPEVRLAYLFGSVARRAEGPLSDVDVAVWLARELSDADRFKPICNCITFFIQFFKIILSVSPSLNNDCGFIR